ncbi:MAG: Spy0128 family protein [Collinsella sp.]
MPLTSARSTYTEPGTYVYKVSEKNAGTTVDGIAYSKNVAKITVTVSAQQEGRAQR